MSALLLRAGKRERLMASQPTCRTGRTCQRSNNATAWDLFSRAHSALSDLPEGQQEEGKPDNIEQQLQLTPGQT